MQGQTLHLNDGNVVLVDNVDSQNRLTIVDIIRIDPTLPDPTRGDPVPQFVRRSSQLVDFVNQ